MSICFNIRTTPRMDLNQLTNKWGHLVEWIKTSTWTLCFLHNDINKSRSRTIFSFEKKRNTTIFWTEGQNVRSQTKDQPMTSTFGLEDHVLNGPHAWGGTTLVGNGELWHFGENVHLSIQYRVGQRPSFGLGGLRGDDGLQVSLKVVQVSTRLVFLRFCLIRQLAFTHLPLLVNFHLMIYCLRAVQT